MARGKEVAATTRRWEGEEVNREEENLCPARRRRVSDVWSSCFEKISLESKSK
jgi:hypothetical protein